MADVRDYLEQQLNQAIRRPGMFGGEVGLQLYCDALAVADDIEGGWTRVQGGLRAWGASGSTGVTGAVERVLGRKAEDVMASGLRGRGARPWVAARGRRHGPAGLRARARGIPRVVRPGPGRGDVRREFGQPSLVLGSRVERTLVYGTSRPGDQLVFFHLGDASRFGYPGEPGNPLALIAGRSGGETFAAGFAFTPRWAMSRDGQ